MVVPHSKPIAAALQLARERDWDLSKSLDDDVDARSCWSKRLAAVTLWVTLLPVKSEIHLICSGFSQKEKHRKRQEIATLPLQR